MKLRVHNNIVKMGNFSSAIFLLITITVGNYFVNGQSTIGDCSNDEQSKYNSDAFSAVAKGNMGIQSELQNLKKQISHLENQIVRQTLSGSRCPHGFNDSVFGFPKCYAVLQQIVDWGVAQQKCRQLHSDSHLTVINGAFEQQIINKIIQNYNCPHSPQNKWQQCFWVGGQVRNISDCKSTFLWKPNNRTSMPIGYNNWDIGEPNCAMNIEKCVSLRSSGYWNDMSCVWHCCSVCEVTT